MCARSCTSLPVEAVEALRRPRDIYAPDFVALVRTLKSDIVEVRAA